ncbi:MAG TPA: PEP-utilizing enzyme [Dehalococcoidia bacterium]|nr:PEP-utilizing enzyme [Dehalococcoidia bacterium]
MTAEAPLEFPTPASPPNAFWVWDKLHCPRPLTPMEQEMLMTPCAAGFTKTMFDLGSTYSVEVRFVNYYPYLSVVPGDLAGETAEARLARYGPASDRMIAEAGDLWYKEWEAEIMPAIERERNRNYASLSDDDLMKAFDEMRPDIAHRWAVHGRINYSFVAAGRFAEYYAEVLNPEHANEGYEALQGHPSKALESSRGMWRLSRLARANPEVRRIFETAKPDQLAAQLNASEAGRAFMKEVAAYLADYGWRTDSIYELMKPAWWEDPSIALNAVQGYINIDDSGGPDAQYNDAVARRTHLMAEARRRLASEPEKLAKFEAMHKGAAKFTPVSEDHNHWIDQMGDLLVRYPALEIGKRLVAKGSIANQDDVFFLFFDEISEAMKGKNQRALASQRRQEFARAASIVPPPVLGAPAAPSGDPMEEVLVRFFGTPLEPNADPKVINGMAASPGTVTGTAKVVRNLNEASKLQPGDIMVCEMTLPPWTPLFATISGVVTDTGGMLSHSAIVAREYRIPGVVGTAFATAVIKDGMRITVDGSRGLVRIED